MFENVSIQAILAGISYGVIFLLQVINISSKFQLGKLFMALALLFGLCFSALIAYDINCLTAGKCTTWSWIRTVSIILILPIMFIRNK